MYLFLLVSAEISDFDLQQAINYGMLPPHYLAKNPHRRLSAYIDVYLKEEIKEETKKEFLEEPKAEPETPKPADNQTGESE